MGNGDFNIWDLLKHIPLPVKFGIAFSLVFLFILIAPLAYAYSIFNFQDYSDEVAEGKNVKEAYEGLWYSLCDENDTNCTEEEKKQAQEFLNSHQKFYDELDKVIKDNNLSKEQRYIILTTIFLSAGNDIETFDEASEAISLSEDVDTSNESDLNSISSSSQYEEEKDSIKELAKQFKTYGAVCTSEDGTSYNLKNPDGKDYSFTYMEYFLYKNRLSSSDNIEGYSDAVSSCDGTISYTSTISTDNFYNYLENTNYFDKRDYYDDYFSRYANSNGLDSDNVSSWSEEDKKEVRKEIIDLIKELVEYKMNENKKESDNSPTYIAISDNDKYWWPIGSVETTEANGVLFAAGPPYSVHISSPFAYRYHPKTGKYHLHSGIDIAGFNNKAGVYNVIAAKSGTVTKVVTNCISYGDSSCGGTLGNYIIISHNNGITTTYGHLHQNTITVKEGQTVSQGQVIAKVGSSGSSTGAHLHFTVKSNGSLVQPLDYVNSDNPRPTTTITSYSNGSIDFHTTAYSREEFITVLKKYYSNNNCNSSSSSYRRGCNSFKSEVINSNGAGIIYDVAKEKNVNPQIVVARSIIEGYSPGSSYNYFGYGCTNTGGLKACYTFSSFRGAMETFFKNVSKYNSLEDMMSKYAYLGDYWYSEETLKSEGSNPSGVGGCYYAKYIYPNGIPQRVKEACTHTCGKKHTSNCVKTTEADHQAYQAYQAKGMVNVINKVFN